MVPPGTLQTLRRLFRVMLPHRRTLVLTGALAVVSQALGLV
ncbi:MAG: hypothetical protein QOJ47_570, partial [Gaiellales bacterium]|nr:hypothetical protein [Gaiellales bacterium]